MILCDTVDDLHELIHFVIIESDLHALSAQYIRRTYQNRITDLIGNFLCLFCGKYRSAGCSRDTCLFQNLIKEFSVLCGINILCLGS